MFCCCQRRGKGEGGAWGHMVCLLVGGVESNPGPREDFQLRPEILQWVLTQTGWPAPGVDAFAAPHNALLPHFWDEQVDALQQCGCNPQPVWCNPPFHLMGPLCRKLRLEGGGTPSCFAQHGRLAWPACRG